MQYNLDHLPASKQRHLEHIVTVLREECDKVIHCATDDKRYSKIIKIILFGSHATGKWVNKPAYGYVSDYDILVIVSHANLVEENNVWHSAESRIGLQLRQPFTIVVHTLDEVNQALVQGQYFFTDIKQQGIVLYEIDQRQLAQAGSLTLSETKQLAEQHFAQWFESAAMFFKDANANLGKAAHRHIYLKHAAFLLHQATERYYSCLLLVLTNYKPYTHNLIHLNSLCIKQAVEIAKIFPQANKQHKRCFQLLKHAYIDARYSVHYKITQAELEWLAQRVGCLQQLTSELCQAKIASFTV